MPGRLSTPACQRSDVFLGISAPRPVPPLRPWNDSPLPYCPRNSSSFQKFERVPTLTLISQTHPTLASSSNFQIVFNNALRTYEKHTKKDLLSHPLAAQLQACASPSAILDVLHQQVQELNQPRNSHQRLTKWLDPTVNVLCAFSETLGEGVSLVCLKTVIRLKCAF